MTAVNALDGYLWEAPPDQAQEPPYSAAVYRSLVQVASQIASRFALRITAGYMPGSQDLHGSGLAFDMSGHMNNMKRAAVWAHQYPGMFQQIYIHDEGAGMILQLGFYPDSASLFTSAYQRYAAANAPTTAQSPGN